MGLWDLVHSDVPELLEPRSETPGKLQFSYGNSFLLPFLSHTPQIYKVKQRAALLLWSCSLATEVTRSAETMETEIWEFGKWVSAIPAALPHGRALGRIRHFGLHSG